MGDKTGIEWTDASWNPTTGCSKVSQGCKNCYAERGWSRLVHLPAYKGRAFTDVACHPERIDQPLLWKKPRRIFVNSMSDLFHESVPDSFLDEVFTVMANAHQNVFQVLTKRPDRMRNYINDDCGLPFTGPPWPLPNVWLGVSVEDQETADERIPILLQTPAAVRWISAEPLLGPVDLLHIQWPQKHKVDVLRGGAWDISSWHAGFVNHSDMETLDWVVVGGESGPKARPMHPDWVRSIRDQCASSGVPFLFKQWGEWGNDGRVPMLVSIHEKRYFITIDGKQWTGPSQCCPKRTAAMIHFGKRAAGRLLDGVQHDGYPETN